MKRLLATALLAATLTTVPTAPVEAARPTCTSPELRALAYYAGWPPNQINKVMRTMYKESRCQPSARNKWATGLMQVHKLHLPRLCKTYRICTRLQLLDPYTNLVAAHDVWQRSGWRAWTGGGA